jgi:hypothetical protein
MSNTKNTGGPAFPQTEVDRDGLAVTHQTGMTLRDYFAAKAMQGFISCGGPCNIELDTKAAYIWADEMLSARGTEKAKEEA